MNNKHPEAEEQERPKTMAERLQEESDTRRRKRNRWLIVLCFAAIIAGIAAGLNFCGNAVVGYFFNSALESDINAIKTCSEMNADELKNVNKIGFELHRYYMEKRVLKKYLKILNRMHYELQLASSDKKLTKEELEPIIQTVEDVLYGIKYESDDAW